MEKQKNFYQRTGSRGKFVWAGNVQQGPLPRGQDQVFFLSWSSSFPLAEHKN